MPQDNWPEISPLIERWHPHVSTEEKKIYTEHLRGFISSLYNLHESQKPAQAVIGLPEDDASAQKFESPKDLEQKCAHCSCHQKEKRLG